MPAAPAVLRLAAFTDDPAGGNPAGVVLDAGTLSDADMQAIAAEVGYSETAFITGAGGEATTIRYFSPLAEVPFCGHATIATGVALARRDGPGRITLDTRSGRVVVDTQDEGDGLTATLTSVAPHVDDVSDADVDTALDILRWDRADLDPELPPRIAFAGARHLILGARTRARLADLDYDFGALKAYMLERDLTTVALLHRTDPTTFAARNPFPVGGVVEDPATGAAAAAFGAYLRTLQLVDPPVRLTIHQGEDLGRPSLLHVDLDADPDSGVRVTGRAVDIA
jgi:PhzF family phenazine biosynthesis protein